MTTATFFTGSVPVSGQRTASPVSKAGAQATFKAPRPAAAAAAAVTAYPWMTQAMFSKLGVRARRLLRADY